MSKAKIIIISAIVLPVLILFLLGGSLMGIKNSVSKIEPARAVVINSALGITAPFSLQTHTIAIPEKFIGYHPIRDLTFSPDGTRAAYSVWMNNMEYVIVDNQAFNLENFSRRYDFKFSEDSNNLFFLLQNNDIVKEPDWQPGSKIAKKSRNSNSLFFSHPLSQEETEYHLELQKFLVKDFWSEFSSAVQSPDSKKTATIYQSNCGPYQGGNAYVTITSENNEIFRSKGWGCATINNLTFSPDGQSLAYKLEDTPYNFVAINDKPGQTFGAFANGSIRFSPDGKYIAYGASVDDKIWWIVEEIIPMPGNGIVKSLQDIK